MKKTLWYVANMTAWGYALLSVCGAVLKVLGCG